MHHIQNPYGPYALVDADCLFRWGYNASISAVEKAGEWRVACHLFDAMHGAARRQIADAAHMALGWFRMV